MKIGIANDHNGVELKQELTKFLTDMGYDVENYGTDTTDRTDYTTYGFKVGEAVRDKKVDFGIAICGSAIGISIACNKVKGVRCGKCNSEKDAVHGRECDFINVIALAASTPLEENKNILLAYLNSRENTSDPAYAKRAKDLEEYENRNI